MSAFIEGKPAPKPTTKSLWTALYQRAGADPNRLAVVSPHQSRDLLSGLVQPWPWESRHDSSFFGSLSRWSTKTIRAITSPPIILSYILSWLLPAPDSDGNYLRWSFLELQRATVRVASLFQRRGVPPGATVFYFTPISAEWALLLSVSVLNRYSAVTLRKSFLQPGSEHTLQEQIDSLSPSVIVVAREEEARHLASKIDTKITLGISLETFTSPAPVGWVSIADIVEEATSDDSAGIDTSDAQPDNEVDEPKRTALIAYTSGSTGNPKGCPLSVHQLLSALGHLSKLPLSLLPAPLALVSSVNSQSRWQAITITSWATGNAVVLDASDSSAESVLASLQTCRPVTLPLLVTAVRSIARANNYSADAIKSVRYVHLIGSTITMAILRAAQGTFPRAKILTNFAMTEATAITSWAEYGRPSVDNMPSWHGIASSGQVAHGAALKIVNAEGAVAEHGEVGQLHLRGDCVISSYVGDNSDKRAAFYASDDGHRWFVSGDDAVIDAKGLLYVLGRSEYTVRRDEKVVVPSTIEHFLEMEFQQSTVSSQPPNCIF